MPKLSGPIISARSCNNSNRPGGGGYPPKWARPPLTIVMVQDGPYCKGSTYRNTLFLGDRFCVVVRPDLLCHKLCSWSTVILTYRSPDHFFSIPLPYTKEALSPLLVPSTLVNFQTAYKITLQSSFLAGKMDKKNPNLYY